MPTTDFMNRLEGESDSAYMKRQTENFARMKENESFEKKERQRAIMQDSHYQSPFAAPAPEQLSSQQVAFQQAEQEKMQQMLQDQRNAQLKIQQKLQQENRVQREHEFLAKHKAKGLSKGDTPQSELPHGTRVPNNKYADRPTALVSSLVETKHAKQRKKERECSDLEVKKIRKSGEKIVAKPSEDTGAMRWIYRYQFETGRIGEVVVDESDKTLITGYYSGEVGGGILKNKPKKKGSGFHLPLGYMFVVHDQQTEDSFKRYKLFGVKNSQTELFDDIAAGNYLYLYNNSAYTVSGPYQSSTKLTKNIQRQGVFAGLPFQVKVEIIEEKPHGEMERKAALTYMNQGATQAHESTLSRIKPGPIGDGAHEALHDTLVQLGRSHLPQKEIDDRQDIRRRERAKLKREQEEIAARQREIDEQIEWEKKQIAVKEQRDQEQIKKAKESWKAAGHKDLNGYPLDEFVELVAAFPVAVQTLQNKSLSFWSTILQCGENADVDKQRTDLKRVCKQRTNLRMNAGLKYKQTPEFIDDERREMRHRAKLEGGGGEKFEVEQASIQKLKREKSVKEEYYIDKNARERVDTVMEIIVNEIYNAMEKRAAVESKVAPLHNFNFKMRKIRLRKNVTEANTKLFDDLKVRYQKSNVRKCTFHHLFLIDASKSMDTNDIVCEKDEDPFINRIQQNIYKVGGLISRLEMARNSILSFIEEKMEHAYDTFDSVYISVAVMEGGGATVIVEDAPVASPVTFNLVLENVKSNKRGTGCYAPAFDLVSSRITTMINDGCSHVGLFFLTDGSPSDRIPVGDQSVSQRQFGLFASDIERVAKLCGPRLTYALNLMCPPATKLEDEGSVLQMMEKEMNAFHCIGSTGSTMMSSNSISASMTSFSKLADASSDHDKVNGKDKKTEKIFDWERKDKKENAWDHNDEEWHYHQEEDCNLYRYQNETGSFKLDHKSPFQWKKATHLGWKRKPWGVGAERVVYRVLEVKGQFKQDLNYNEYYDREEVSTAKLVWKESKFVEKAESLEYVQIFVRQQARAKELAELFVARLNEDPDLNEVPRIMFIEAFALNVSSVSKTVLVEAFIEGEYKKWLSNAVKLPAKSQRQMEKEKAKEMEKLKAELDAERGRPGAGVGLGIGDIGMMIEEGDEDEDEEDTESESDSEDEYDSANEEEDNVELEEEEKGPQDEDVLGAFAHWTHHHTKHKEVVCDLQGGFDKLNNLFTLTDPAIHHSEKSKQTGATDHGAKGILSIMEGHRCNWLCVKIGLPKNTEMKGRKTVFLNQHENQKAERMLYEERSVLIKPQLKFLKASYQEGGKITEKTQVVILSKAILEKDKRSNLRYMMFDEFIQMHNDVKAERKAKSDAKRSMAGKDERAVITKRKEQSAVEQIQKYSSKIDDFLQLTKVNLNQQEMTGYRTELVRDVVSNIPNLLEDELLKSDVSTGQSESRIVRKVDEEARKKEQKEKEEHEAKLVAFNLHCAQCVNANRTPPLMKAWEKLEEEKVKLEEQVEKEDAKKDYEAWCNKEKKKEKKEMVKSFSEWNEERTKDKAFKAAWGVEKKRLTHSMPPGFTNFPSQVDFKQEWELEWAVLKSSEEAEKVKKEEEEKLRKKEKRGETGELLGSSNWRRFVNSKDSSDEWFEHEITGEKTDVRPGTLTALFASEFAVGLFDKKTGKESTKDVIRGRTVDTWTQYESTTTVVYKGFVAEDGDGDGEKKTEKSDSKPAADLTAVTESDIQKYLNRDIKALRLSERRAEAEEEEQEKEKEKEKLEVENPQATEKINLLSLSVENLKAMNHYELLQVPYAASPLDAKRAYDSACAAYKDGAEGDGAKKEKLVQTMLNVAFAILSDPDKKQVYDSKDFDETIPSLHVGESEFYETYRPVFERNSKFAVRVGAGMVPMAVEGEEDKVKFADYESLPQLGEDNTPLDEVNRFYAYWSRFESNRGFADQANKASGVDLSQVNQGTKKFKMLQKLVDKNLKKWKTAEKTRIAELVNRAKYDDPRLKREVPNAEEEIIFDDERKKKKKKKKEEEKKAGKIWTSVQMEHLRDACAENNGRKLEADDVAKIDGRNLKECRAKLNELSAEIKIEKTAEMAEKEKEKGEKKKSRSDSILDLNPFKSEVAAMKVGETETSRTTYWRNDETNELTFIEPKEFMIWEKLNDKEKKSKEKLKNSEGPKSARDLIENVANRFANEMVSEGTRDAAVVKILKKVFEDLTLRNTEQAWKEYKKKMKMKQRGVKKGGKRKTQKKKEEEEDIVQMRSREDKAQRDRDEKAKQKKEQPKEKKGGKKKSN